MNFEVPASRKKFYRARRKFFYLLDQKKGNQRDIFLCYINIISKANRDTESPVSYFIAKEMERKNEAERKNHKV